MAQRPRQLQPYASADAYFGAQLRSWRIRAGLSQADLARQVHVSGDLIGKIEKAQRRVTRALPPTLTTRWQQVAELTRCATRDPGIHQDASSHTATRTRGHPRAPKA